MYNSSYNQPPYVPPDQLPMGEKNKPPILGILSCVAAVLAVLLFCGIFILAYAVGSSVGNNIDQISYEALSNLGFGVMALMCGSGLSCLVGLILGIISVTQKNTSKIFGIIGLVLNALILFGFCFLFVLGALSA